MIDLYVYRARLVGPPHDPDGDPISDGDTWWLEIDKGFDHTFRDKFRSKVFDAPELHSRYASDFEKQRAREAREAVRDWFSGRSFLVRTFKASEAHDVEDRGKYGRWLAEPFRLDDQGEEIHLAGHLLSMDLATLWPTRWYEIHDPDRDKPEDD